MANKYILIDNELIFGNVTYHYQLKPASKESVRPVGGGYFYYNHMTKTLLIYGSSSDFGYVRKEAFIAAWANSLISPFWEGATVLFSYMDSAVDALATNEDITSQLHSTLTT